MEELFTTMQFAKPKLLQLSAWMNIHLQASSLLFDCYEYRFAKPRSEKLKFFSMDRNRTHSKHLKLSLEKEDGQHVP